MSKQEAPPVRMRLNRDRVLQAAVGLADAEGAEQVSMRNLAAELGVVPMALYKHVSSKEELLDGMVDVVIGEIEPPPADAPWKDAVRERVLSARRVLQRHRWARRVLETRTNKTPGVLAYMDSFIGLFLAAGFTVDLTHHVMHAIGSRMWGFTQELFEDPPSEEVREFGEAELAMMQEMAKRFPNIMRIATASAHESESVVGSGCDDQFEFEFALDLLLDRIEQLHEQGWSSRTARSR